MKEIDASDSTLVPDCMHIINADIELNRLICVQSPQLVKKKDEQPLTVNQFQFSGWDKSAATPTSCGSLMTLLEMVERSQIKTGNHAVVIHCMYVRDTSVNFSLQNRDILERDKKGNA